MKKIKILCLIIVLIINTILSSGCWNYREIDKMAIIAGVAIDMDANTDTFKLTVEVAAPSASEKSGGNQSETYKSEGKTVFEAVRNLIPEIGKKAYWSHSKVIIVSKSIAEQGLASVLDFLYRDAETRRDVLVLVSNAPTAGEIIEKSHETTGLMCFKIDTAIRSQKNVAKYPMTELRNVVDNFRTEESATLLPLIDLNKDKSKDNNIPEVLGSAVLKKDKVVGYLNGDETKYALWVRGKLKGGLFIAKDIIEKGNDISLEIYGNKTKKKVELTDGQLKMKISTRTDVEIGEITGSVDFSNEKTFKEIRSEAEDRLRIKLEEVIKKVQNDYKADIFDFDEIVEIHQTKYWKDIKDKWSEEFASMPVEVETDIRIRGSALVSKTIKSGE